MPVPQPPLPESQPNDPPLNPYAPAATLSQGVGAEDERAGVEVEPLSLTATVFRWLIVCGISAVPSFLFGVAISGGQFLAMILGILIFVLVYTAADYRTAPLAWRRQSRIRRTLKITYGTRIAISILLPLGAYLDIMCGAISIQLTELVMREGVTDLRAGSPMSFRGALLTTLVQGCLLNLVLGVYAMFVYGLQTLISVLRR